MLKAVHLYPIAFISLVLNSLLSLNPGLNTHNSFDTRLL